MELNEPGSLVFSQSPTDHDHLTLDSNIDLKPAIDNTLSGLAISIASPSRVTTEPLS